MPLALVNTADTVPGGTEFPGTVQELLNLIAQYMSITGGETFIAVNFGDTEPDSDHRDFPWFKTSNTGVPIGWFSWNGSAWEQMPVVVLSGPTSSRPAGAEGALFDDTDIGCLLIYTRSAWRTAAGNPGDVKIVKKCMENGLIVDNPNLSQVLAANPGWIQDPDSLGRTIVGVGAGSGLTTRSLGDSFGVEEVVITDDQMPIHNHSLPWAQYSGQHQNGTQPAGIYPVVTGDGSTNTADAGNDEAHTNLQPSVCYFVLTKS